MGTVAEFATRRAGRFGIVTKVKSKVKLVKWKCQIPGMVNCELASQTRPNVGAMNKRSQ